MSLASVHAMRDTGADPAEDRKMRPLTGRNRCVKKSVPAILTLVGIFTLATTLGFAATPGHETIQATYSEGGNTTGITLIVYSYSTPAELHVLSQAFEKGKDQELAIALSRSSAVGRCVIAGGVSYDVTFIQVLLTPTGRQVTFIASRPHPSDDSATPANSPNFDLTVGQFDLNEIDPTRSTGFLFPASKLVVDEKGAFHYDLAGTPSALVSILYSKEMPSPTGPQVAETPVLEHGNDQSASNRH